MYFAGRPVTGQRRLFFLTGLAVGKYAEGKLFVSVKTRKFLEYLLGDGGGGGGDVGACGNGGGACSEACGGGSEACDGVSEACGGACGGGSEACDGACGVGVQGCRAPPWCMYE